MVLGELTVWLNVGCILVCRSYFFSVECVEKVAVDAGFRVVSCHYVHRRTVNKKEGVDEPRIFVQAKFSRL